LILKEKVGVLTDQQRKFLEISYKNLLKLEKNIDNLLDLAEMGIQKASWTFEPVDLAKVIEFSCTTVEPLPRNIKSDWKLTPSRTRKDRRVEDKLNQLFDNLFTNAIKYNRQEGRICVSVEEDAEFVFTRIADTGLESPINPAGSLHATFSRKNKNPWKCKGLGIGLSLVQEIVNLHQGRSIFKAN